MSFITRRRFARRVPPPRPPPRRRSVPSEGTTSTAAMGTHPWKTKRHAFACPARGEVRVDRPGGGGDARRASRRSPGFVAVRASRVKAPASSRRPSTSITSPRKTFRWFLRLGSFQRRRGAFLERRSFPEPSSFPGPSPPRGFRARRFPERRLPGVIFVVDPLAAMDAPPADLLPNLVDVEALARDHAESACAGTAEGLGPGMAPGPGWMAPGPSPVSAPGPIPGQIRGPIPGPISAPPQTPSGVDAKITFAPPSAEHLPGLTVDSDAIGRMFEEEQTRQAEALVAAPPPNAADPGMGSGVSGTEFSGLAPDACPPPPPDDVTDARRTLNDAANNLPFSKEMNETFMDALTAVAASASRSERTRAASDPSHTDPGASSSTRHSPVSVSVSVSVSQVPSPFYIVRYS